MSDDVIPDGWYAALAQRYRQSIEDRRVFLRSADELRVAALKRGSRRWLPPVVES